MFAQLRARRDRFFYQREMTHIVISRILHVQQIDMLLLLVIGEPYRENLLFLDSIYNTFIDDSVESFKFSNVFQCHWKLYILEIQYRRIMWIRYRSVHILFSWIQSGHHRPCEARIVHRLHIDYRFLRRYISR